ncbi:hypothetical protein OIDMADRAFT_47265 [Oidiodendron maius Zn]|uniref:Uncharacterized protein n=1 Tax=Oidiodendron maius (strain Zn) TaxID=913774 RepID=A0A0C3D7M0_OIDMZ|nr:hypothetical protein OIDMADRAFT_47265 [Oidiodendron maius Zn]
MTRGAPFSPWRSITGEGPLVVDRARRESCGCEEHGRRTENRRPSTGDWLAGANAEIGIQKGTNQMSKESKRGRGFSWSTIAHFGNRTPAAETRFPHLAPTREQPLYFGRSNRRRTACSTILLFLGGARERVLRSSGLYPLPVNATRVVSGSRAGLEAPPRPPLDLPSTSPPCPSAGAHQSTKGGWVRVQNQPGVSLFSVIRPYNSL